MDGVGKGWDVTDHQTTAPPLGHVGVTGVNQESIMDLQKSPKNREYIIQAESNFFNCETAPITNERPDGPYFIVYLSHIHM